MRKTSILWPTLLFASLCLSSDSQSNQRANGTQVLNPPAVSGAFKPKLSMQDALKIAEGYIGKQNSDISPYWLYRAVYMLSGDKNSVDKDKIPGWHFWWVSETGTMGDDVEIFVDMNGRASRVPSM